MAPALPGGGIKPGESDEAAVIREVLEETSLQVVHALFLFHFETFAHQHAVFWIIPTGIPQASQEIDTLLYYTPEKLVRVSPEIHELLNYFHCYRFDNPDNLGYNPVAPKDRKEGRMVYELEEVAFADRFSDCVDLCGWVFDENLRCRWKC